tara:strand:- start:800 stop:1339 length:540 start_codon:yes stop_codon:yes gene_type:complete
MRILFLITIFLTNSLLFGQEDNVNRSCTDSSIIVKFYGRLGFIPIDELSNIRNPLLCNSYINLFYINKMLISMEQFVGLKLAPEHLSNDRNPFFIRKISKEGSGYYEYIKAEGNNCFEKIIFKMNVDLLFLVNGVELNDDEQASVLFNIKPTDILAIKRERYLFKKGAIYITTKESVQN